MSREFGSSVPPQRNEEFGMVRTFLVGLAALLVYAKTVESVEVKEHGSTPSFFGDDLIDRYIKETSDAHKAAVTAAHVQVEGHKLRGGHADKTGHVVTVKLDSNLQVAESTK
eukprot:s3665_g3.t1